MSTSRAASRHGHGPTPAVGRRAAVGRRRLVDGHDRVDVRRARPARSCPDTSSPVIGAGVSALQSVIRRLRRARRGSRRDPAPSTGVPRARSTPSPGDGQRARSAPAAETCRRGVTHAGGDGVALDGDGAARRRRRARRSTASAPNSTGAVERGAVERRRRSAARPPLAPRCVDLVDAEPLARAAAVPASPSASVSS